MNGVMVDPAVMGGVPCVRGTRVPVVTITGLLAENMSIEAVLEHYPQLTVEDVHACQALLDHLTRGRSGTPVPGLTLHEVVSQLAWRVLGPLKGRAKSVLDWAGLRGEPPATIEDVGPPILRHPVSGQTPYRSGRRGRRPAAVDRRPLG